MFTKAIALVTVLLGEVFGAMRPPRAAPVREHGRPVGPSIAQLIAVLDDRDTRPALDVLDRPASGAPAPGHRIKCVRGCR